MAPSPKPQGLDTNCWLVSDEGAAWLDWLEDQDPRSLATLNRLKQQLTPEQVKLLLAQHDLRARAVRKFPAARQMFFTDIGLQQATDLQIATYKAQRFPADQPLADLCCGIGGDLIALAQRGGVTAVDASQLHLLLAAANVAATGGHLLATVCQWAEESDLTRWAAWHIDPDRRVADRRATRLENFSPPLDTLSQMLHQNPNAALKLAPASTIPAHWAEQGQVEWISHLRECKQQVVWLGSLARRPGSRRATRIVGDGQIDFFEGTARTSQVDSSTPGRYLFDPDPALVASGLLDTLAHEKNLARLSPKSQYLTATVAIAEPLLQTFEVLDVQPIDVKRLRRAVSDAGWGVLELKQRGVELKLEPLRQKLKPRGSGEGTIIFTPTVEGNRAILCRRVAV